MMAKHTPAASPEGASSTTDWPFRVQDVASSPVLPTFERQHASKPRKAPTITPRSFTRFFTPKSSLERSGKIGASRQALRDITVSGANRKGRSICRKDPAQTYEGGSVESTSGIKRKRRTSYYPNPTPDLSSPLKRLRNQSLELSEDDSGDEETVGYHDHAEGPHEKDIILPAWCKPIGDPILWSKCLDVLGRDLHREISGHVRKPRVSTIRSGSFTSKDWQYETTDFFTKPDDTHVTMNVATPSDRTIPFCTASCTTNSLVAIGDEDGGIRLLESAKNENPGFSQAYLKFQPHANAILDLAFSPDDMLLATASGDQTSQVIDMPSQRAIYTMAGHVSSIKQVCFQPGSSSVIATSSRDGSVQIWDLRCKGFDTPMRDIKVSLDPNAPRALTSHKMILARSVNTIFEAHTSRQPAPSVAVPISANKMPPSFDTPSKSESPGRRGDVSITALSFLNPGREHLLITASEANASVKLWDLRTTHNHRRARATPLSSTRQPESHTKHRHFGVTSLSLSSGGARLYTLCRDNTIYAYSTSHLILGHAPELSSNSTSKPRRTGGPEKEGLGPTHGFRHPSFHATTFYVKSALRETKDDQTELLAVGSSDGTPVLFPTDECYMQRLSQRKTHDDDSPFPRPRSRLALTRTDSGTGLSGRPEDAVPIYQQGSALVRGHGREVTGLTWTRGGELITVSDDFSVRCWREGGEARSLRVGGEGEGRRWGCGWAEATTGWDDDDG
ncbi:MAG: hypothetical protein Q9217_004884 [Psora testacea]